MVNFSTKTSLDILKLDFSSSSAELDESGSIGIESRFNKLVWSDYKNLIIGGADNSRIYLYDYEKIVAKQQNESLVCTLDKHALGGVFSLDINPFQHNLLASGGSASEILVWDLNNPQKPMTPGWRLFIFDLFIIKLAFFLSSISGK